jgi:hypothetical protein
MLLTRDIDPARLAICDATSNLDDSNGVLGFALAQWAARDDSKGDADARHAGNTAMDTVDAMLRELHTLRSRLAGEIRDYDDASAVRVDAMLLARKA